MNSERFLQPLVEHLLLYVGLDQTLAYVSTCKWYRKERKWSIEQHAVVDHKVADQFAGGISIKYRSRQSIVSLVRSSARQCDAAVDVDALDVWLLFRSIA